MLRKTTLLGLILLTLALSFFYFDHKSRHHEVWEVKYITPHHGTSNNLRGGSFVNESYTQNVFSNANQHKPINNSRILCASHIEEQLNRRQLLADICKLKNITTDLPPRFSIQTLVDDDRKLIVCSVFKTGSTLWRYLMMVTSNTYISRMGHRFQKVKIPKKPSKTDGVLKQYGIRDLKSYTDSEIQKRINEYHKIMFVRNPMDRLVSAFRDKYTPGHPGFDPRYYKLMMQNINEKYHSMNAKDIPPLSWSEFVDHVTNLEAFGEKMYYDDHIDTLDNLCRPCAVNYDFIAKFEDYECEKDCIYGYFTNDDGAPFPEMALAPNSAHFTKRGANSNQLVTSFYHNLTLAQRRAVVQLYNRDCLMFGYKCDEYL